MTIVTREMIGAAHDVMLAKCDFVLSANLLERIYLAMDQAAPPTQTPFDSCQTCEALNKTIAKLRQAIESMRVAGGSVEFQAAFDKAKLLAADRG